MKVVSGLFVWSLLVSVTLAGCGQGELAHARPLSKAQFISRADAICLRADKRLKALQKPTDLPGIGTYTAEALPIVEEAQRQLDALAPPSSDKRKYTSLLGMVGQSVSKVSEVRNAAEAGEAQRVQRLGNDLAALQQGENGAAEGLGLKQCVSNGEAEA
jgi:hypothetical protein